MSLYETSIDRHRGGSERVCDDLCFLTTQAVVDLHVARRVLRIYPISHEQVKRSIVKAYKSLAEALDIQSNITLAVLKDRIRIGDQMLDDKNSAIADFAGILKHYQIATVTFDHQLDIKELARFLQMICADREKVMETGGIEIAIQERNFSAVQIQTVDYGKLQLTSEQEIHRPDGGKSEQRSVWQEFVSNLPAPNESSKETGEAHLNPSRMAQLLNQQAIDIDQAIDQYQNTLTRASAPNVDENQTAKELLAFQQMIKELDSDLKMQFLSATFDYCGYTSTDSDTACLVDGLGGGLIIEMIRRANSEGRKISPSLLAFIEKMGHSDIVEGGAVDIDEGDGKTNILSSKNVKSLLAHERYDTYVDSKYDTLLHNFKRDAPSAEHKDTVKSLANEVQSDLTGGRLHTHVGRAITRLMNRSHDHHGYRDWARQLTFLLDDLLESRSYPFLMRLMGFIRHEKKSENQHRANIAGLVLDRFSESQFVSKALQSLWTSQDQADQSAMKFLKAIGEPVVVEILDSLDKDLAFDEPELLAQILIDFGSLTVQEALQRLNDPNPEFVRRMIRIIRKIGDSESAQQVRLLIDHQDMSVRMEALATLIEYHNKWGLVYLREVLGDPNDTAFIQAIRLAGRYRVRSVVPQLQSIAEQRGEQAPREAALRALGCIGDPQTITILTKIVRRRWSVTQKQNKRLRRVVFETLGGYPQEVIQDLLHYGLRQKDDAIRSACQLLVKKRRGEQRTIRNVS